MTLIAPSARELLQVWERGMHGSPVERALLLATLAAPEPSLAALAQWSVGARDTRLFDLRTRLFGDELAGFADCPGCGERLEFQFRLSGLRCAPPQPAPASLRLRKAGYAVRFRLPNSEDLLAVARAGEHKARRLFERCVLQARRSGQSAEPCLPEELPPAVAEAVIARMAEADPQADVELALQCPGCQFAWLALFDIAAFLWQELHGWAARLLREVHVLAAAYGWSEADILALSPARRRCYLDLVGNFV